MGLFALPSGKSKKEYVEAAFYNLKLWIEEADSDYDCDYLLKMAEGYLNDALSERKTDD